MLPSAAALGVTDVLVLRHTHGRSHLLVGGAGRGHDWAGSVAAEERDEPRLVAAREGQLVRVRQPQPTRVVGPYWASTAVVVALDEATVVLGGDTAWVDGVEDEDLQAVALDAAEHFDGVTPQRDLPGELETYQRLRALMAPVGSREATAHHVAREAAAMLGVELLVLRPEPGAAIAMARPGWPASTAGDVSAVIDLVSAALPEDVLVIQDARDAPLPSPLAPEDGVLSMMVVPLTSGGVMVAAHTTGDARGFTSLDRDVGTLIAEIASVSLAAADTITTLDRHVERIRWQLSRDPVTGLPDLRAWDEALRDTGEGAVVVVGLGDVPMPDHLLQVVGAVLERQATDTDLAARTGDGEFGLLLRGADLAAAREIAEAVRSRLGDLATADGGTVRIGAGGTEPGAEVATTVREAWRMALAQMLQS